MKLFKFLLLFLFLCVIGVSLYAIFTDVPIQQSEVTKVIPNERIFDDK